MEWWQILIIIIVILLITFYFAPMLFIAGALGSISNIVNQENLTIRTSGSGNSKRIVISK